MAKGREAGNLGEHWGAEDVAAAVFKNGLWGNMLTLGPLIEVLEQVVGDDQILNFVMFVGNVVPLYYFFDVLR